MALPSLLNQAKNTLRSKVKVASNLHTLRLVQKNLIERPFSDFDRLSSVFQRLRDGGGLEEPEHIPPSISGLPSLPGGPMVGASSSSRPAADPSASASSSSTPVAAPGASLSSSSSSKPVARPAACKLAQGVSSLGCCASLLT